MLARIVGRDGANVKPFFLLQSSSCVAALCLCVAQILVQLSEFSGPDRLLRAFVDVTVTDSLLRPDEADSGESGGGWRRWSNPLRILGVNEFDIRECPSFPHNSSHTQI